jgi:hypothetical protein
MSIPPHALNIYQKPAVGDSFLKRLSVYNYRHTIAAVGGFDTASCDIAIRSREEGQQFLDQYIGNRVAFYVDNPVEPIWEGFINRMTFDAGGVQYTISLDEMTNRVQVTHTDPVTSATIPLITTASNNTDSQAIYGIKQDNIEFGVMRNSTGATALRDTVVAQRAWPQSSITRGGDGGLLHIEFLGFWHTLNWEIYVNTATTATTVGALVLALLSGLANGTTFFNNADTADVIANSTAINNDHNRKQTAQESLMRWQEMGNAGAYTVVGVTPTLFSTGTRRLYYRNATQTITYTARQSDGLRIRNLYGQLVSPWTVRPDTGIRVSDMLIGWNGIGDNPAETYIQTVTYDANQQTVDYQGDDDTRAEGAFQLRRYGRPIGKKFSATVRRSV